jgi:hypothetical protein
MLLLQCFTTRWIRVGAISGLWTCLCVSPSAMHGGKNASSNSPAAATGGAALTGPQVREARNVI